MGSDQKLWAARLASIRVIAGALVLGIIVFLSEEVSLRLVLASVATLSGITIVLLQRSVPAAAKPISS